MSTCKLNHEDKNIEFITCYFIRNQYEKKYNKPIPWNMKLLISQYVKRFFKSSLLSFKQDIQLNELLFKQLKKQFKFKLFYRGSIHNFSGKEFHNPSNRALPSVVLIKSNWGNLFGGFTTQSWYKYNDLFNYHWRKDDEAFLFLLKSDDLIINNKCPLIFKLKVDQTQWATYNDCNFGPIFGRGHDLFVADEQSPIESQKLWNKKKQFGSYNYCNLCTYYNAEYPQIDNICGGNVVLYQKVYLFNIIEYEVFHLLQTK